MFGLREAGALAVSVAAAGGVAYLIWNYASCSGERKREEPRGGGGEAGKRREEAGRSAQLIPAQAAPQVAAKAPEQSRPADSAGTQVLVLGLDGSGKTSLLQRLASGGPEQDVQPTQGFNAVSINREDLQVEFLEIGGKEDLRPYWQRYMSKALLLVFVVDASCPQRFPLAKSHLHELLAADARLPLMVLANKQDLPGSCNITDLHDALSLSEVGDRRLFLIGTHVKKGEAELSSGVQDARDLIIQMVCDSR